MHFIWPNISNRTRTLKEVEEVYLVKEKFIFVVIKCTVQLQCFRRDLKLIGLVQKAKALSEKKLLFGQRRYWILL